MLLRAAARLHGVDPKKIHPRFEHFDRVVTVLVFVDMAERVPHIAWLVVKVIILPLRAVGALW